MMNLNMQIKKSLTTVVMFCGLTTPLMANAYTPVDLFANTPVVSEKLAQARLDLRDMMLDQFFWTASSACSVVSNDEAMLPVAGKKYSESLQAIEAFATNYCGAEKARELTVILKEHYDTLMAYAKSVATNDAAATTAAEKSLYANSERLANYLSQDNEHLNKAEFTEKFNLLIKQYTQQINFAKAKDVNSLANLWGDMKKSVYGLADLMISALAKKYPDKF